MKSIFKILTVATLLALYSCNDGRKEKDSSEVAEEANEEKFDNQAEKDADFVEEVVAANYAEIKLAELANQRSRNTEVKQIAQKLQTDHSGALNELKTFAQAKSISVPVEETDESKKKIEKFTDESGDDFDKKWCKEMIDKHEDTIDKFEKRMDKTEDADLKAWIDKTLPTLRSHYDQLKACNEKIKDKG